VHGALIVMPPGKTYNPATDKSYVFSQTPNEPFGVAQLLMNGVPQHGTMQLRTGVTYRFRFINITPSVDNLHVTLKNAGVPVQWRIVAKDAADVAAATLRTADQLVAVSETYDFEYTATSPQQLTLEGYTPNDNRRVMQTLAFSNPQ